MNIDVREMFHKKFKISNLGISEFCERYKFRNYNRINLKSSKNKISDREEQKISLYLFWWKIKFSLIVFSVAHNPSSAVAEAKIPSYQKILHQDGVRVYQSLLIKYSQSQVKKQEYITVIDTRKATIKNLTGNITGNNNSKISKKILSNFWQDALELNTASHKVVAMVNGAFFSTNDNPTDIAFGLKTDNNLITYGYAIAKEYPGQIRAFAFRPFSGIARIQNYTKQLFSHFPEVLGALHPLADKSSQKYLPRTFIGVSDLDNNGTQESVVLYSSNYARQIDAIKVLRDFRCRTIAMLDGGGSTGLIVNGRSLISTNRPIPHAIAVYAVVNSSSN